MTNRREQMQDDTARSTVLLLVLLSILMESDSCLQKNKLSNKGFSSRVAVLENGRNKISSVVALRIVDLSTTVLQRFLFV
mmetsp:Transcript_2832/g.4280  ORF Transcript_2832/g.4280 Transcript_2832/m.4280 type:complete len:80 (-) Transcript_2832:243-482(-)